MRIEDLDAQRCRPEYAAKLIDDLRWLGFSWEAEPLVQSARGEVYERYFEQLKSQNLVYPCFCSRADILAARAPHASDGIVVYGGRCKHFSQTSAQKWQQNGSRRGELQCQRKNRSIATDILARRK